MSAKLLREAITEAFRGAREQRPRPEHPEMFVLGWLCQEAGFSQDEQLELISELLVLRDLARRALVDLTPRT